MKVPDRHCHSRAPSLHGRVADLHVQLIVGARQQIIELAQVG